MWTMKNVRLMRQILSIMEQADLFRSACFGV